VPIDALLLCDQIQSLGPLGYSDAHIPVLHVVSHSHALATVDPAYNEKHSGV
jgi:hypothetical protein